MEHEVYCENPQIILNPAFRELVAKNGNFTFRGVHHRIVRPWLWRFGKEHWNYSAKYLHITEDDFESCYIVSIETGELLPMYIKVACGKCALCKDSKLNSFAYRCHLETLCYNSQPWFVTLTYDEEHKPLDGLSVSDVQLFLKRFRINLQRLSKNEKSCLFGLDFNDIRYVVAGEYGKNTMRPHYHLILWGIPSKDANQYAAVSYILSKSWSNGFISRRLVNPSNNTSFTYTAKYLRKIARIPLNCNKPFINTSRRHGGIGSRFLDKVADDVRKRMRVDYQFVNPWTGKVEELKWTKYGLDRIFPSLCKSIPSTFRNAVQNYCLLYLSYAPFLDKDVSSYSKEYYRLFNSYSRFIYIPSIEQSLSVAMTKANEFSYDLAEMDSYLSYIVQYEKTHVIDFAGATAIHDKRNMFLYKLDSQPREHLDVKQRSIEIRKKHALSESREIL